MKQTVQPVSGADRIQSLDILRGFAVLGILLMNIQSFSMPGAAYLNPMAYGDMSELNGWVWKFSHVFADQKFMTLFSILYGAGILLVTQNAEKKFGKSAGLHYRRTFWLLNLYEKAAHETSKRKNSAKYVNRNHEESKFCNHFSNASCSLQFNAEGRRKANCRTRNGHG